MCVSNYNNSKKLREVHIRNHNAPIKNHNGLINRFNEEMLQVVIDVEFCQRAKRYGRGGDGHMICRNNVIRSYAIIPKNEMSTDRLIVLIIIFSVHAADKSVIEVYYVPATQCQAELIPEGFFPSGFGIAMPKGSPYKPFFDHA